MQLWHREVVLMTGQYTLKKQAFAARIDEITEFARKAKVQLELDSQVWIKGMVQKNIRCDISQVLWDIQTIESNIQCRKETTWVRPDDKVSARRVQNTMGYIVDRSRKPYTEDSIPPVTRALDVYSSTPCAHISY